MNMRKSLTMNLLKKEKIGNKRKITLFGFLKISYKKNNDEKHQKIIITDGQKQLDKWLKSFAISSFWRWQNHH